MDELEVGKRVHVSIEKMVTGGDGLGHLPDGRVVFVSGALPGEEVLITLTQKKRDFAKGKIVQVISPSRMRGEPKCPYYGECGGCDMQHILEPYQARVKEAMLRDTMQRMGSIDIDSMRGNYQFVLGPMWEYRTRAKFHIDRRNQRVGFLGRYSSQVIPIEMCPILDPRLNQLFVRDSSKWLSLPQSHERKTPRRKRGSDKEQGIDTVQVVAVDDGAVYWKQRGVQTIAPGELLAKQFLIDGNVFFQSNQIMFTKLLEDTLPYLSGRRAIDLFSGVGTFAAFLQDRFESVVAVERDERCLEFANHNLDTRKVVFYRDAVEKWINGRGEFGLDLIVVDPPRTGLPVRVIDIMLSWKPKKILYVSCNPVTLARDLKVMNNRGYNLRQLTAYDFYPQTSHLEAAAVISRIPRL